MATGALYSISAHVIRRDRNHGFGIIEQTAMCYVTAAHLARTTKLPGQPLWVAQRGHGDR